MVRVNSMSRPDDPAKPVVVEVSDASGRAHALTLSSRAAVTLGLMLSRYTPVKQALAEPIPGAPSFRVDDFFPIIELELEAKQEVGQARILAALAAAAADDAQIRFAGDATSCKVKLAGIDELQLDQIVGALRSSVGEVFINAPQVGYREQITRRVVVDYTHKKRTGSGGEFANIRLVLEPLLPRDGIAFMGVRARKALSEEYIAAVEHGVRSELASGVLAGFPVIGVRALLVDGAFHDADSSALAFEIAGRAAIRQALRGGDPVLIEPIMQVDIVTPEQYVDAIVADLKSRRGSTDGRGRRSREGIVITANVPAVNLFGYENALRSMSAGRARFTQQFDLYARVPRPDDPSFRPAAAMRA
jgi:elongation factor G